MSLTFEIMTTSEYSHLMELKHNAAKYNTTWKFCTVRDLIYIENPTFVERNFMACAVSYKYVLLNHITLFLNSNFTFTINYFYSMQYHHVLCFLIN